MPLSTVNCLALSLQKMQLDMCVKGYTCRYWALELSGAKVGGKTVGSLSSTGALLDSGTSLIFTSDADAAALNNVSFSLCKAVCVHGAGLSCTRISQHSLALDVSPCLPMLKPLL